jgi:hypothetical protein
LAHEVPQVPLLQAPARHCTGAVQAPGVSVPHLPSAAQVPETQAPALVHAAPVATLGAQAPAAVQ